MKYFLIIFLVLIVIIILGYLFIKGRIACVDYAMYAGERTGYLKECEKGNHFKAGFLKFSEDIGLK